MNYLKISSFIEAEKKRKAYLEEELRYVSTLTSQLKAGNPVILYNNLYYIVEKLVFITLSILSLFAFISNFIHQNS